MEIKNLILSPDKNFLLGSDNQGNLYTWLFKEILTSFLKSNYDGMGVFTSLCKFKLQNNEISQLQILAEDSFLVCCGQKEIKFFEWKEIDQMIVERKNSNIPMTEKGEIDISKNISFNLALQQEDSLVNFTCFTYIKEMNELVVGSDTNKIFIFDIKSRKLKTVLIYDDEISLKKTFFQNKYSAILAKGTSQLIAATEQGIIQLWDLKNNKLIETLKEKNQEVFSKINAMIFEDSACNWLICAHDDYITKWNLHLNALTYVLETKIKTNCIVASNDHFLSGHDDEIISKWSLDGNFINGCVSTSKAISSLIAIQDSNKSLLISSGCGSFVDVFYNNYRIFSFIAQ